MADKTKESSTSKGGEGAEDKTKSEGSTSAGQQNAGVLATKGNEPAEAFQGTEAAPNQPAEARAEILSRSQAGANTVTGYERSRVLGNEKIPEGKERGSQQEIEGDIKSDYYPGPSAKAKPQGAQAQPANLAVNGTVPVNMVPSPFGPIPRDAARSTAVPESELLNANGHSRQLDPGKAVPEELLNSLDAATLRAVAADRGYTLPHAGTRTTRSLFRQKEKERFGDEK